MFWYNSRKTWIDSLEIPTERSPYLCGIHAAGLCIGDRKEMLMDEILVSVIIPAYNCTPYIRQALDSALIQDVPMEILVLDDCSTDDLDSVMAEYSQEPRIVYLKGQRNQGVAATRNRGVAMARGEYIAFLDADDIWAPGKLKKQLALIQKKNMVICSTARELMNLDGTLTGYMIPVMEEFSFSDLVKQNQINCSSVLIKTEVAKAFPMHHDDSHEDYLMWMEVLKKYGKGCAVNEPLLKYRISNQGKSGNKLHSARMTFQTYRYMGFGWLRSIYYFTCYAIGGTKKYFLWFLR